MSKAAPSIKSVVDVYAKSIVALENQKHGGYYDGAMPFLAGYLQSQLESVIAMLPKAKQREVLADMARDTIRKEAQAEVLNDQRFAGENFVTVY
jgi:hypothetical protein